MKDTKYTVSRGINCIALLVAASFSALQALIGMNKALKEYKQMEKWSHNHCMGL